MIFLLGSKPLRIRFDEIDGFVKVYDEDRYLVWFGSRKHNAICNRVLYLISQKSGITFVFSHNYAKIKVD